MRNGHGINIEPNSDLLNKFKVLRPKDISLNFGIGSKNEIKIFYKMMPDVGSTFSKKNAKYLINKKMTVLIKKQKIQVITLEDIFKYYWQKDDNVDFISIDTEGYDYQVLQSNNWNKYRAKIICIETCIETENKKIKKFMQKIKYKLVTKTVNNSIYIDASKEYLLQNVDSGSNQLGNPLQCKFRYFLTPFPRLFSAPIKENTLPYYTRMKNEYN